MNEGWKRPELQVTARDLAELERLLDAGADAVRVGDPVYGMRVHGVWPADLIEQACQVAHARGKKVIVAVNRLLHDDDLDGLADYLRRLAGCRADGVIFGDPAVWMAVRDEQLQLPLHYSGEMTTTNYAALNYWHTRGVVRGLLARELNLEEFQSMRTGTQMELQIQVHGATCIYHSLRSLVSNYERHIGRVVSREAVSETVTPADNLKGPWMKVIERERPEEVFPIIEDAHGTHMFSSEDICGVDVLQELLPAGADSFFIEGILMSEEQLLQTVRAYREMIDGWLTAGSDETELAERGFAWVEQLRTLQPENRPLAYGFFFKEQVY